MIKEILVALDPDEDTPVATRYAIELAKRFDAQLTGFAAVDTDHIENEATGAGIGAMYYADKIRERLGNEARVVAHDLLATFAKIAREANVRESEQIEEGTPAHRIVDALHYADMLVLGHESHFFYSHPGQSTDTLQTIVQTAPAPVFIVQKKYREIKKVLLTFDGSPASSRTMQRFAQLQPFGTDIEIKLLHVFDDAENAGAASEHMLDRAKDYLNIHGFKNISCSSQEGEDPENNILQELETGNFDLLVSGARVLTGIKKFMFGSTTNKLIAQCHVPLFMHH